MSGVLETALGRPLADALGWALLHSLWQGALVGIAAAAALGVLRRSAADIRYLVATMALALMVTLPAVTTWSTYSEQVASLGPARLVVDEAGTAEQRLPPPGTGSPPGAGAAATLDASAARVSPRWLPLAVILWLAGVTAGSVRLLAGWALAERLRRSRTEPAPQAVERVLDRLCLRLRIRLPVRLRVSSLVDVPTVVGWIRPALLVPASAIAGLSPDQLAAILAHELAHIRRYDYLVNLLQSVVETLLFYHPAAWWLSGRIRIEREHCCDDLAVSLCGDPVQYVRALAALESRRGGRRTLALAASGGSLLDRVRRLLGVPSPHTGQSPAVVVAVLALAATIVGVTIALGWERAGYGPALASPRALAEPRAAANEYRAVANAAVTASLEFDQEADLRRAQEAGRRRAEDALRKTEEEARRALEGSARGHEAAILAAGAPVVVDPPGTQERGEGHITRSNDGRRLELRYAGRIEITDDDRDIKSLSPGGHLIIKDGRWWWFADYRLEIRADAAGRLERKFWVDGNERPYEPEGREWLAKTLIRLVRTTGMFADTRVARLLKTRGPQGVLDEIAQLEGDYARRIYFEKLLTSGPLETAMLAKTLTLVSQSFSSDYERSRVLRQAGASQSLADESVQTAYVTAATGISSDYELSRTLRALLDRDALPDSLVARIIDAAGKISSDYERSQVLRAVASRYPVTGATRASFFRATDAISSDYERGRVLAVLADRREAPPDVVASLIQSARAFDSDYEAARFLMKMAERHRIDGPLAADYFKAVETISSDYERQRVLAVVAERTGLSEATLVALLKSASAISSDYELARLLVLVARTHRVEGLVRDAYLEAAEHVGSSHETGRVMTALVGSERRK